MAFRMSLSSPWGTDSVPSVAIAIQPQPRRVKARSMTRPPSRPTHAEGNDRILREMSDMRTVLLERFSIP